MSGAEDEHDLYDREWERFRDAGAVEFRFLGRSPGTQSRLNRFTLWALGQPDLVRLDGMDVLEFGAGHGRLPMAFPSVGSYVGVERSENLARLGRHRLDRAGLSDRTQLVACDCMSYDGREAAFDVVCSLGMFASVPDAEAVLRKMVYHLKPGGRLFIDALHSSPVYNWIHRLRVWTGLGEKRGVRRSLFSRGELRDLFHRVGLADVRVLMREYPVLGSLYADRKQDWALDLRNRLARSSWLDVLGTVCFAFGTKPS
jgi:cyclopropane fatty-acyl-phospholipid synthase-like methyltransferase